MKKFLLVFWRIIRWIIYLVLILALPFVGTFGYTWIRSKQNDFVVHFDTAILEQLFNYDSGQHVVMAKINEIGNSDVAEIIINGNVAHSIDFLDFILGYANADGEVTITISNGGISLVEPAFDLYNIDGTYLILGAILGYIVICIIAGVRRKKKNLRKKGLIEDKPKKEKKSNKAIEKVVENEVENSEVSKEAEIVIENSIVEDEVEEVEYVKEKTLEELIQKEPYEEFKYVEEKNVPKEVKKEDVEVKWCKFLAENGDKEAQYALAVYYANGYKDVEQNPTLAKYWLEKSANAGYDRAVKAIIENK